MHTDFESDMANNILRTRANQLAKGAMMAEGEYRLGAVASLFLAATMRNCRRDHAKAATAENYQRRPVARTGAWRWRNAVAALQGSVQLF
ncbi:hypothetical protein [Massilia sp. PWRC2]|uniref:hypothetical protein n=1 Tax=Massilia sp. PWRC2 TaxID=2804626 RepID=UPI003CF69B28